MTVAGTSVANANMFGRYTWRNGMWWIEPYTSTGANLASPKFGPKKALC